jgi:hypothetical protein
MQTAAGNVPARVIERFTRRVQPVLVNNCTASGCHQAGGPESFQLDRALLHGLSNRRSTMNNLAATLKLVDRERPQLSPLLTVPRSAHGGVNDAIFGPRQEQAFRHLVEWVTLATAADRSKPPAPGSAEAAHHLPAPREQADAGAVAQGLSPSSPSAAAGVVLPVEYEDDSARPATATPQPRFGAQVEKWLPRDPFDAEIFNRQHLAKRRTPSLEESNARPANR